jgi:hypothetical protein
MSKIETIKVECPECKEKQTTTLWHSLNTTLDPEDKELLFAGKINTFHCQKCSHEAFIPIDFMYHDMRKLFCVQFYPPHKLEDDQFFNSFTSEGLPAWGEMIGNMAKQVPHLMRPHIVFDMGELIRYVMFRDGLAARQSDLSITPPEPAKT